MDLPIQITLASSAINDNYILSYIAYHSFDTKQKIVMTCYDELSNYNYAGDYDIMNLW